MRDAPPEAIYHDLDPLYAAVTNDLYVEGSYLLDPFFLACEETIPSGAFRVRELAPGAFHRSQYYRRFFSKIRLRDEIGIFVEETPDQWMMVSIARTLRRPRFTAKDCAGFSAIHSIIAAALQRQWGNPRSKVATLMPLSRQISGFGTGVLSPREGEVVRLILLGHTSASIADCLEIAEGTVKVHRRQAYTKLGVSSQAELFSQAASYLSQ